MEQKISRFFFGPKLNKPNHNFLMKPNIILFHDISELINKFNEIESNLLSLNQSNIDEILELIASSIFVSNKDFYYILLLSLNFIMESRPFKDSLYKKVLLYLKEDYQEKHFFEDENEIISIFMFNEIALYHLGINKTSDEIRRMDHLSATYPTPYRYNPRYFSNDLFEKSIREDDIDTFQTLISRTNKDLSSSYVTCPSVNPLGYFSKINVNQIHFISFSAFCGSLRIFKYLWMNRKGDDEGVPNELVLCAIAGGNYEIIHILDDFIRNEKFSLMAAIRFFRFELIEYLIETCEFEIGLNELLVSIHCCNYKFFCDNCKRLFELNKNDFLKVVLFAADCGNTLVLNYISDSLQFDLSQSSIKTNILIESVFKERINVLRFIFFDNVFSIDYDQKTASIQKRPLFDLNKILNEIPAFNGLAILHLVASNQLFKVANFFLSDEFRIDHQVFIDVNVVDSTGTTPLHWSVLFQHFEMFKLFISKSNASFIHNQDLKKKFLVNVNAVNIHGQNILHMACNNMAHDILKFILENEIIDPKIEDNSNENLFHYAARCGINYIFDYSCVKNLPNDVFSKKDGSTNLSFNWMAFSLFYL